MPDRRRQARVTDIDRLAAALPHVTVGHGPGGNAIYAVGGKSFVFFRTPRPDAVDPVSGARWDDVVVFWVPDGADKRALVEDARTPWFTTPHFDGHPSVLLRTSRIGELIVEQLAEVIEDAWQARASPARAARFRAGLSGSGRPGPPPARRAPGRSAPRR